MERLVLACGGTAMNSVDEMDETCLGSAGLVYEHVLGENKFTFVEQCANPLSVTILMKGPNKHTLTQVKDAVRDGLRSVKNALEDGCVVPGAGAYEVACHTVLKKFLETVKGKARLGIQAYADGLMIIPKTLAANAGYDSQEVMVKLLEEARDGASVGMDAQSCLALDSLKELLEHCVTGNFVCSGSRYNTSIFKGILDRSETVPDGVLHL